MVELEILSKREVIPLGILLLLLLLWEPLCIPSILFLYTGETLDYKAPLLRALNAVDEAATDVMHYFDKM